jgi:hypothetical protein
VKHGSPSAYSYHKCRCEICRAGQREYMRRYRGSVTRTTVPTSASARLRAAERLIRQYPDEFQQLLSEEVAGEVAP